jgi:hypothetical protein
MDQSKFLIEQTAENYLTPPQCGIFVLDHNSRINPP